MHLKEVFNAIYANHAYEYFVIDEHDRIVEHSDRVFALCKCDDGQECDNVFVRVPELVGLQEHLDAIRRGISEGYTLPNVHKSDEYINIHLRPGRKREKNKGYETIIVLFEIVTDTVEIRRHIVQERNEKSLVLQQLEMKNRELDRLNKEMEKRVEEATRKYIEKRRMIELQSRHSQMGEMIGMITHQWKQPIGAMLMLMHVLQTKSAQATLTDDELQEKLDKIKQLIDHMNDTVVSFQDFFNPSRQAVVFKVRDAIDQILHLIGYHFTLLHIDIEVQCDDTVRISGYPNEFNQVILALLNNAKDAFLRNPHDAMRIIITIEKTETGAKVSIRDNAGGILEDVVDTIFEPYVTTKKDGSGIGLNIARMIIEEHFGGTIEAHNTDEEPSLLSYSKKHGEDQAR